MASPSSQSSSDSDTSESQSSIVEQLHQMNTPKTESETSLIKFKGKDGFRAQSLFSAEMIRVLLDHLDENKGKDGLFVKDIKLAIVQAKQAMVENVPSHLLNDLSIAQIQRKYETMLVAYNDSRDKKSIKTLWLRGSQALNLLKLPKGVYGEDKLGPLRKKKQEDRAKWRAPKSKRGFATGDESGDDVLQPDQVASLRVVVSTALVKDSPNTKKIQEAMDDIRKDIEVAVLQRLQDSGISGSQPVALNTELFGPRLQSLIAMLLSCDISMIHNELPQLSSMIAQQPLQLDHFLRALAGAAVTQWALEPVLQQGGDPMYRALLKAIKKADATAAAVLCGQATRECLQEFEGKIPEHARLLADKFDYLLAPFLCPPASSPSLIEDAVDYRAPASRSSSIYSLYDEDGESLLGSMITVGAFSIPRWFLQWKKELNEIFEEALKLRVTMEIMGGRYQLVFPRPGSQFTSSSSNTKSSRGGSEPEKFVMLALLPTISGSFQSTPGGSYGDLEVITNAPVCVFKQPQFS